MCVTGGGRPGLTYSCERGGKSFNDFRFDTFIGPFLSDGAASIAVKGLNSENRAERREKWLPAAVTKVLEV